MPLRYRRWSQPRRRRFHNTFKPAKHCRFCSCMIPRYRREIMENHHKKNRKSTPDSEITLTSFVDETTLHGLKGACDVKYSRVRRAVWCAVLLVMSGVFIAALSLTLQDYFRYVLGAVPGDSGTCSGRCRAIQVRARDGAGRYRYRYVHETVPGDSGACLRRCRAIQVTYLRRCQAIQVRARGGAGRFRYVLEAVPGNSGTCLRRCQAIPWDQHNTTALHRIYTVHVFSLIVHTLYMYTS